VIYVALTLSKSTGVAMPTKYLTDRTLGALRNKPPAAGQRVDYMDTIVSGFGVRVNDAGKLTYILNIRYPGDCHPTRRTLGQPGEKTFPDARVFTLADARDEALRWRGMVKTGQDPKAVQEKAKREAEQKRSNTFAAVAEDFIADMKPTERRRVEVAQAIRRELIPLWGGRSIVEITPLDVVSVVKAIKQKGHLYQARNLLGRTRRVFHWAIAQHAYGLERSPCAEIRPSDIIGERQPRQRILNDAEIRAVWKASGTLGYPYGPLFQMLMLTGQRRSEIAKASRPEIDKKNTALVIPAERMKANTRHIVPLCDHARAILETLPTFEAGDYLFSATFGRKPVHGFSKAKANLDKAVTAELGEKPKPFTIHDMRRTVRTHLSALPIPQHVAERIIAHTQSELSQTYDLYSFLEEKRHGLALWESRLREIVTPPPAQADNVVLMKAGAA
jgi:integrase